MWKPRSAPRRAGRGRPVLLACAVAAGSAAGAGAQPEPAREARFVVVGDSGTGDERARSVAAQIRRAAETGSVSHAFLLGDNVYDHGEARFIGARFLDVFRGVLDLGVRVHAALGNHDVERCEESGRRPVPRDETAYALSRECEVDAHLATPEFGYRDGSRYYSVEIPGEPSAGSGAGRPPPAPLVEVFVLDTNTLGERQTKIEDGTDDPQLRWIAEALARSRAHWKVVAMHHTIQTPKSCRWFGLRCRSGDGVMRAQLEPLFSEHGVDVVFQGHEHLYARRRPRAGMRYFVSGAGGKKADSFRHDARTVSREDRGAFNHFMVLRVTGDRFNYCVIDAEGAVRDRGGFARGDAADGEFEGGFCPAAGPP